MKWGKSHYSIKKIRLHFWSLGVRLCYGKELLMLLYEFPMLGPSSQRTAITIRATRERMIAYSIRPWPFSFGADNMAFSFLRDDWIGAVLLSSRYLRTDFPEIGYALWAGSFGS